MDIYRCECGTLCRPPVDAVRYACTSCGAVREETVPDPAPPKPMKPAVAKAEAEPEAETCSP